jgi:hypothetical protein
MAIVPKWNLMRSMVVNLMWNSFFTKINNKKCNYINLREQRHFAEKINGTAYQVYGYNYYLNLSIRDQDLNGLEALLNK